MTTTSRLTFGDAIVTDEVGIHFAVYGDFRLRSAYRPIFKRRGDMLVPVAVEGLISPHRAGMPIFPAHFFAGVSPRDGHAIDRIGRALHVRNHRNIGVEGLELYLGPSSGSPYGVLDDIDSTASWLGVEIYLPLLVCEIFAEAALDDASLQRLANEMRRMGIRIAIGGVGTERLTQARIDLVRPEIVKVDGDCFRVLCREPATARLLDSLVSGFHDRSAQVLIQGVDDAARLRVALDCGADLFQGDLLGSPALAGAAVDWSPRVISSLLGDEPKVLRLFR